MQAAST